MKTKIEPGDVRRDRDLIYNGQELAVFAFNLVNAEKGGKYKFERYLYDGHGYYGFDYSDMKSWQHVSMFVRELNGEKKMIIFAELTYSDGVYETITHVVLDPKEPAGIRYGCGFCFPSHAGPHISPHPADFSKFVAGHWTFVQSTTSYYGLIPPPILGS